MITTRFRRPYSASTRPKSMTTRRSCCGSAVLAPVARNATRSCWDPRPCPRQAAGGWPL